MQSPVPGVLLILGIAGAVADRRYLRAGGARSTRRDKLLFSIAIGLSMLVVGAGVLSGSAELTGDLISLFGPLLFALWELGRFRTRRRLPIGKTPTTS